MHQQDNRAKQIYLRNMENTSNIGRRRFLSMAALTFAAAEFGDISQLKAENKQSISNNHRNKDFTSVSFDNIKQIKAGVLDVGYAEVGPANGQPVILLHGWPYDIHSYIEVSTLLADKGYRVIVPYLRGHGTTQFLSAETPRNGQPPRQILSHLWMRLKLKKPLLVALTGEHVQPTSLLLCGLNVARPWYL
jgi:hypothetical protein